MQCFRACGAARSARGARRRPQGPLPGGYGMSEMLHYVGASQTLSNGDKVVHGQRGEVVGPAMEMSHKGKGLAMRFPSNKDDVECTLAELSPRSEKMMEASVAQLEQQVASARKQLEHAPPPMRAPAEVRVSLAQLTAAAASQRQRKVDLSERMDAAAARTDYHEAARLKDQLTAGETMLRESEEKVVRAQEELDEAEASKTARDDAEVRLAHLESELASQQKALAEFRRAAAAEAARLAEEKRKQEAAEKQRKCAEARAQAEAAGNALHVQMFDVAEQLDGKLSNLRSGEDAPRFEARAMVFGLSEHAAEGIERYMCISADTVRTGMNRGLQGIVAEVGARGTSIDKECGLRPEFALWLAQFRDTHDRP